MGRGTSKTGALFVAGNKTQCMNKWKIFLAYKINLSSEQFVYLKVETKKPKKLYLELILKILKCFSENIF